MARIYANRCEKGGYNFYSRVPKSLQAAVRALIEEDGYVILDDGTVVEAGEVDEADEDDEDWGSEEDWGK